MDITKKLQAEGCKRLSHGNTENREPSKELNHFVKQDYAKSEKLKKSIIEEHFGVNVRA